MSARTRFETNRPFAYEVTRLQKQAGEAPVIATAAAGFAIAHAILDLSEAAREIATEIRTNRKDRA